MIHSGTTPTATRNTTPVTIASGPSFDPGGSGSRRRASQASTNHSGTSNTTCAAVVY